MGITWGRVKAKVLALGFEKTPIYDMYRDVFINAANSAIDILCTGVRPMFAQITVNQIPIKNLIPGDTLTPKNYSGNPLIYSAKGASAYYFECDGSGTATIEQNGKKSTVSLSSQGGFIPYKNFCNGDIAITFSGNFNYSIRGMAIYERLTGDALSCIPENTGSRSYNIAELAKMQGDNLFMGFAAEGAVCEVFGKDRRSVRGNCTQGEILRLPSDFTGQAEIKYKIRPPIITEDTADEFELQLDSDAVQLLPLLMSNQVWLDDDERKAAWYWNKYEMLKDQLAKKSGTVSAVSNFLNKRGW